MGLFRPLRSGLLGAKAGGLRQARDLKLVGHLLQALNLYLLLHDLLHMLRLQVLHVEGNLHVLVQCLTVLARTLHLGDWHLALQPREASP